MLQASVLLVVGNLGQFNVRNKLSRSTIQPTVNGSGNVGSQSKDSQNHYDVTNQHGQEGMLSVLNLRRKVCSGPPTHSESHFVPKHRLKAQKEGNKTRPYSVVDGKVSVGWIQIIQALSLEIVRYNRDNCLLSKHNRTSW